MLKRILLIYSIVTVVGTSLLWLGGIGFFNSVCYAMGTVSSGCFSPETSGIASYSPFIQYLLVVLMGLSGIGYFAFILIASGRIRYLVKNNDELKLFGLIILSATLILTIIFFTKDGFTTENAFRCGLFQAVSFLSSSGFSMYNYIESTENVVLIMMILAIIGGCLGSTSGGIKVNRLSLILKNLKCSFYQLNDFSTSNGLKYNREMIDERTNISVLSFVALFGIITVVGILVLILTGISPSKSAFLVVTSITSIGHNLNMSDYSSSIKIILSILMLIGRLEIYPVLLLLLPSFYRNGNSKNNLR